jgi:hypothetical protein
MAKQRDALQPYLPGVVALRAGGQQIPIRYDRIPHNQILAALQDSEHGFQNIVETYRRKVLTVKTRIIPLLGRKCRARIIQTLLGYEVKASNKRVHCPDMVTARYIKIFTEVGCKQIRLPYDPTLTASLIPTLETALEAINTGVHNLFPEDRKKELYTVRALYRILRSQLRH